MNTNIKTVYFFILYIGIMFIITYLQQEFVLLPELQNIDLVGDEIKAQWMEKYQKLRWLSFLIAPLFLAIRLSLVSLCFLIGSFFYSEMNERRYQQWLHIATVAQSVMVAYSLFLCATNIIVGSNQALEVSKYTSLLFLANDLTEQWIKLPLSAINIFEIVYWFVMANLISKTVGTKFGASFKFVMSTYGVGYLLYIVLLMFLMLYLGTNV